MKTEVVLKYIPTPLITFVTGLMKTEVVLKCKQYLRRQWKKRGFNENRSCIEIFRKRKNFLELLCLMKTEVVLKFICYYCFTITKFV